MAAEDTQTKAVGPYLLQRTLGKGQTGEVTINGREGRVVRCPVWRVVWSTVSRGRHDCCLSLQGW